ncbi:hypothetical protein ACJJTC_001399 [Scirpophaga incertulas]
MYGDYVGTVTSYMEGLYEGLQTFIVSLIKYSLNYPVTTTFVVTTLLFVVLVITSFSIITSVIVLCILLLIALIEGLTFIICMDFLAIFFGTIGLVWTLLLSVYN